ncbi:monovalent cation/H(+) antiporter subunit G [Haloparvum sp. AD34]
MSTLELVRVGLVVIFAAAGLFFTFVSMAGVIRLPDVFARAHTASQADTLGAGFGLAAVALVVYPDPGTVKTVLLLFFIFVTNPTAAHAIARAAFEDGHVPWTETPRDEPDRGAVSQGSQAGETGPEEPESKPTATDVRTEGES